MEHNKLSPQLLHYLGHLWASAPPAHLCLGSCTDPGSQPSEGHQGQFVPLLSELRFQVEGTAVLCCLARVPAKKSVTMLILDLGGRAGIALLLQLSPVGNDGPHSACPATLS